MFSAKRKLKEYLFALVPLGTCALLLAGEPADESWLMDAVDVMYSPGSTFLLVSRKADEPILPSLKYAEFGAEELEEAPSWEEFIKNFRPLRLKAGLYHEAKKEIEFRAKEITAFEEDEELIAQKLAIPPSLARLEEAPRPKPPELEIPEWEGKVSIAGRKLIALSILNKKYLNSAHPLRPRSTPKPTFDLRQELQLRISGNVSDRVSVNVDYDDTKENKRDISIVYRGGAGETVKEISFGDITLNLPQTQFTSYSKQLFGIKAEFDFKRARLMVVGSQTKGQFTIKRFSGQYQFESADIKDTDYIRRTYYDLTFSSSHLPINPPIKTGSVMVYRDDRNPLNDSNAQDITAEDYDVPASTYSGKMDLLIPGIDYVVDHQNGILRFMQVQQANAVIAVDYTAANGQKLSTMSGTGKPKIIKTDNDLKLKDDGEAGYKNEIKTFYSFRRTKIMRDDGKGSFMLKLLEKGSRKDVSADLGMRYPDQIQVDFEQGTFQLTKRIADSEVYLNNPVSKYIFAYEIRFVLKTYMLGPNIVLQSEKVYKDGRLLTRDSDYFIDYDSGFLTFLRPETITPDTQIEVTYEVAPFGSQFTETLIGTRGELDLIRDVSLGGFSFSRLAMGSSILLQQAAKPPTIPDIRSLPTGYSIYEGDARLTGLRLPFLPFTFNMQAEIAQSLRSPNTFKKALIESMEGIKIEDSASLYYSMWFPAPNPDGTAPRYGAIGVSEQSERIKTIYPGADASDSDTQQILQLNYDLSSSTQASIQYLFSSLGMDFSNKEYLELALAGDTTSSDAPEISFNLGRIAEDADGDSVLDSEDINKDGGMNFGEDIGWIYNNPDGTIVNLGAANGRLDTEDLDRNGRLDTDDPSIGGRFGLAPGSSSTALSFNSWIATSVPLGITALNQSQWVSIKSLRITLKRKPGGKTSGIVRLAKIGVSANRWERPVLTLSSGTFQAGPINNVDNADYTPLYSAGGEAQATFDELYGGSEQAAGGATQAKSKRREQALRLKFENLAPTGGSAGTAATRFSFTRPVNFQSHKVLAFFFNGPKTTLPAGTTFFFQFGSANDYYEYQLPIGAGNVGRNWYLLKIRLDDTTKDGIPDRIYADNHPELSATVIQKGSPNLASVSQLAAGIAAPPGSSASGEVWFDDVFMLEPRDKKGIAKYWAGDFSIPGWMSGSADYKYYNQDFESPGQAIVNQCLARRSASLSITRLSFMPVSGSVSRETILTPSVLQTGSNLMSQLLEGRIERKSAAANGALDLPLLPPVSWSTSKGTTDNKQTKRIDETEAHSGSFALPAPLGLKFIQSWSNSASRSATKVTFAKEDQMRGMDNLRETTETLGTTMSLGFFKNRWTFSPNYGLSLTKEKRTVLAADDVKTIYFYPKARSQSASLSSTIRLFSWFEPNASFSSTIAESHRVESSSFTLPGISERFFRGDLKSINRQANLSVSQNFDFARIMPFMRLFRSFNHYVSYQNTDGDSYENVFKDFKAADKLWVRKPLEVKNPGARRTNLTMRDALSVNSRWTPFIAIWPQNPLSTLSIGHNFSKSLDRTETTGTSRKSLNLNFPDLTVSMSQIERVIRTHRWMSSTSLSTSYSERMQSTINIDKKQDTAMGTNFHFLAWQQYDFTTGYSQSQSKAFNLITKVKTSDSTGRNASLQVGFNWNVWRLTSKVGYSDAKAMDSTGKITQDQKSISPAVSARGDFSLPAGLGLPFSSKRLTFTNRVILTSDLSLERKSSSLSVDQTNTDNWNWNLNGDFEIGKNLRAGLGSAVNLFRNRVLSDLDYYTYSVNAQVVFQF